jgi:hypothetical protein
VDIALVRLHNALRLRDQRERKWRSEADPWARTVEAGFAGLLGLNPSHCSQLKSGHRHIGSKVARQIEARCRMGRGSLDTADNAETGAKAGAPAVPVSDDEERDAA